MERKLLWKFNIIDLALIAAVLIAGLALVYKATWGRGEDTEQYLFTYTCTGAPRETFEGVLPGLACSDGDYGAELGTLTEVRISPAADTDLEQAAVFVSSLEGQRSEHGVMAGDVLYLKGKQFNLIVGDSIFPVYLSDIQKAEE